MEIKDHKLTGVEFIPSPNIGGRITPDSIIIHYTAGSSAASSIKTLTTKGTQASAHIVIARDGKITQLVPFNVKAWHAGRSEYNGRSSYNNFSVGIELDNAGKLTKIDGKYYSWFKQEYPVNEVYRHVENGKVTYWHNYTPEQVIANEAVCKALMNEYCIRELLGHEEISPFRKIDPGKAFDMQDLRTRLGFK